MRVRVQVYLNGKDLGVAFSAPTSSQVLIFRCTHLDARFPKRKHCLQVQFYLNGKDLGVAFTGVRVFQPHLAYFPAVSLSQGEACSVNVGALPFRYPVPGFLPLQAPPLAHARAQCSYLVSCLGRIAHVRPCCLWLRACPALCLSCLGRIAYIARERPFCFCCLRLYACGAGVTVTHECNGPRGSCSIFTLMHEPITGHNDYKTKRTSPEGL